MAAALSSTNQHLYTSPRSGRGRGGIRAIMAIMAIIGNTNISRHYKIMQCSLPIETWDMRTAIAIVAVKSNLELFDTCQ